MPQRVHILGICGTFMGGVALLARELGYQVTGSDANVYPPMSAMLADAGIDVMQGYQPQNLEPAPDIVIVGNALSRGNPEVEAVLNRGIAYTSGPQWLKENLLSDRWVIAVSGTHGKTTTSSMVLSILESAGLSPGYLIGGVPKDFGRSARLGSSDYFVVEADEYDSAFFDKRSKFVHYMPNTLVIGNLEFDHADIFDDLDAIQRQFHHLVRCVPGNGQIIHGANASILQVLDRGPGIPEGERQRVFQPFYRLEQSRSVATGGSGLGLAIVKQLCDAQGWRIEVTEHGEGGGAVFTVTLPPSVQEP